MNVPHLLRFRDLKERGIVANRTSLNNWIRDKGFPPGRMIGPNTRVWTDAEISEYIASRPAARVSMETA